MQFQKSITENFRTGAYSLAFLGVYVAAAFFSTRFFTLNGIVTAFWLPAGLALAALLVGGWRYAPAIFAGGVAASFVIGCPWWIALGFGSLNLVEATLAFWCVGYLLPIDIRLNRAIDYFRIFVFAGVLATLPTALGGASLLFVSDLTAQSWSYNFAFWWMGDSLGVMVITPLILIWRVRPRMHFGVLKIVEGCVAAALAFLAGQVVLVGWLHDSLGIYMRPFMMFVFVAWAAVRFGLHATLFVLTMIILQVLTGTVGVNGQFAVNGKPEQFVGVWLYMALMSAVGMMLATYINERKASLTALREVTENLEEISALARVGGWELDIAASTLKFSREALRIIEAEGRETMAISEAIAFVEPDARSAYEARIVAAIGQGAPWDAEFAMRTQQGRRLWVRSRGYPVREDGRIARLVGTIHDLTYRHEADKALEESNERLSLLFKALSEGVSLNEVVADASGEIVDHRILEVNDAFYRTADFKDKVSVIGGLGSEIYDLPLDMRKTFWSRHKNATQTAHTEYFSPLNNRHFLVSISPVKNRKFAISFFDITERKRAELALKESEDRYRKLVESSADAILVHQGGFIVYANPAAAAFLRAASPNQLMHRNIIEFVPQEYRTIVIEDDKNVGGRPSLKEGKFLMGDGEYLDVEVTATETVYGGTVSTMIVARDITARMRAEERIRYLGQHDILTGLPNRALFADRLAQTIALAEVHSSFFALLFLDIDHFKKINDSLGHHLGDLFLREVTARLEKVIKTIDTVSRQGGDEFLLLLGELSHPEDAAVTAQKICEGIAEPFMIEKKRINASVSVGIAVYPRDGMTAEALIKNADIAMYRAKDSGRNQFQYFSEELNRVTHERLEIEAALREALRLDQLEVFFQPQASFATGKIESCEALVRWRHPRWGMIAPAKFIPIAEESGLGFDIGKRVLASAVGRFKELRAAGFGDVRIAVNVGAKEIQNPEFKTLVREMLKAHEIPEGLLEIEVTESMLMQDTHKAMGTIGYLSNLGAKFSIDDFGTGYSSLSYLRQLKIHYLKIDQSFVRDLVVDTDDAAIVQTIIGLAHNLRLRVIAEGVETAEQYEFLKKHGCDLIQGFFLAKPMPFRQFLAFLSGRPL